MKKRLKIKQLLLGVCLSILGLLTLNSVKTNAIGFNVFDTQDRIQNSQYIYYYNGIPCYSYGGANLIYNADTNTWRTLGGTTVVNGQYVQQVGNTLYYFGGTSSKLYKINPNTDTSWTTFTTSNYNFYGDYMYYLGDNLYYSNGNNHNVLNPSDMSWTPVTWTGDLTQFYGNSVIEWNNNYYYISGSQIYIKTEGLLQWELLNGSLGATFSGVDTWQYNGDLYYTNSSNSSLSGVTSFTPTYKFNTTTNMFETIEITGSHRFGGRMVYYFNNIPHFAYYYSIYQLNYIASGGNTEEAYQEGYNTGYISGSNNGLLINTCDFQASILVGPCDAQYYSISQGSIYFDELNDHLYSYSEEGYSITFTFTNNISADALFYVRFKETEGPYISFYNDNTLLETLYNDDFDTNQSNYYKVARLSDFGQISTPFNKIVVNNINYDYSISEFGVLQNQSYNLGEENGEIYGYNSGFTMGSISGYERGYIAGEESGNNIPNMIGVVMSTPVNMLSTIFNFEFLGINLTGLIFSLITLLIVIWLIKKFI